MRRWRSAFEAHGSPSRSETTLPCPFVETYAAKDDDDDDDDGDDDNVSSKPPAKIRSRVRLRDLERGQEDVLEPGTTHQVCRARHVLDLSRACPMAIAGLVSAVATAISSRDDDARELALSQRVRALVRHI